MKDSFQTKSLLEVEGTRTHSFETRSHAEVRMSYLTPRPQ